MIGLVVALPREIPLGFARAASCDVLGSLSFPLYRWTTASCDLVAVRTGVGHARAAAGARLLVQRFSPHALVSFGFAGGLLPGLTQGTLVIGDRVVSEDPAGPLYEANHALVEQILCAARAERLPVWQGAVVAAKRLVPDSLSKAALARKSGGSAVDMETSGIVEVAREAGLEWVAVRAIVDTLDDLLPVECLAALRADGRVGAGQLVRGIWRSPSMIRNLLWLAYRTAIARRHLSCVLQRWARDVTPQYRLKRE